MQWIPGDRLKRARHAFDEWKAEVAGIKAAFKEHVYDNPNPTPWDFRQHRAYLHWAIGLAERLAVEILADAPADEARHLVSEIEEAVKELAIELAEWHTPAEVNSSIPKGFKEAMGEANSGKVVAFEF